MMDAGMNTYIQLVFGLTKPNLHGRTAYLRLLSEGWTIIVDAS